MAPDASHASDDRGPGGRLRSALLQPERLEILAEVAETFPDGAIERGRRYAADDRVEDVRYGDQAVRAAVRGNRARPYDVTWRWSDDGWTPSCTCPVAPECKHAFALACVILARHLPLDRLDQSWMGELPPARLVLRRREEGRRAPRDLTPDPVPELRAGAPGVNGLAGAVRNRGPDTPPLKDDGAAASPPDPAPPRALSRRERAALQRLRESPHWIERVQALAELLDDEPLLALDAFDAPFGDLAEVDDPDVRCFVLARAVAARSGGRVPPALAPFLDRPDIRQRFRAIMEQELTAHVEAWVGARQKLPTRRLRLSFQLHGERASLPAVSIRAHLSSRRLDDEPRTGAQLRQLLVEAQRDVGVLPPDQLELLAVLQDPVVARSVHDQDDAFLLEGAALLRVVLVAAGTSHATWSDGLAPTLAARAGLTPGQPVRLGAGPVEIAPALQAGSDPPRVVLEHRLPGGRLLGEDERLELRTGLGPEPGPTLVLAEGAFWITRGDLPLPLPFLFAAAGGFDPTRPQARELVEPLARAHPGFRASLEAHTRVHSVQPVVCLDLRDDDWLQLRAFASAAPDWHPGEAAPPGSPLFEWSPESGWATCADGDADDDPPADPATTDHPAPGPGDGTLLPVDPLHEAPTAGPAGAPQPSGDGTLPPEGAAPPPGLAGLQVPDPQHVQPVVDWIEALGAEPGTRRRPGGRRPDAPDRARGAWLQLSARTAERLADAWEARPAGVTFYGNAAARRLLQEPSAPAPRLRVESSGVDWFSVSAEWEREGAALSDADLAKLRSAGGRFVKLASGWARRDQAEAQDEAAAALAELGLEAGAGEQRLSTWQLVHARPEALAWLERAAGSDGAAEAVRALREKVAAFKRLRRVRVPRTIKAKLRPYQRDGLDFLAYASSLGLGVILADDMGLGKTLQALAWLARLVADDPEGGPSLVVCPASVVHNWQREAGRFAPRLRVLALTSGRERQTQRERIPEHDLVVTNYALLRRDREALAAVPWRAVILDEAQNVKNPDAAVSRAARALQARHRLALTGTPLENRALDLWSLQACLNPGYLGSRAAFVRRYDRSDAPPHARALLAARLRPVMLRRLKQQVAPELPPRIEEQLDCTLTAGQRKLYLAELARGRALLEQLASAGGVQRNKISILAVLTRLRQICCHPALAGGKASLGSGKFTALFEVLEPLLEEGHKVLVFSQFVECLKLVEATMRRRGIAHHVLTGASRRRGELVAAFEADERPCAFLVSLKAGGTGLNLTAASYVVLLDPWWNPAVEAQAIDRTHRIGQDRTVIAYRLVTQGTIEERIRELQQRKAALARDVLGEDGFAKALTRDDLDYLLAEV